MSLLSARSRIRSTMNYPFRCQLNRRLAKASASRFPMTMSNSFQSDSPHREQVGFAVAPVEDDHPTNTDNSQGIPNGSAPVPVHHGKPNKSYQNVNNIATTLDRKPTTQAALTQSTSTQIPGKDVGPSSSVPVYHRGTKFTRVPYWQKISRWKDITEEQWLDHSWGTAKNIQGKQKFYQFLSEVLPPSIPPNPQYPRIRTSEDFVMDVMEGIDSAPMSIRLTPHILSCIDWSNPLEDPIRRQFIPMKTSLEADHPMLSLDSLHETEDSPVEGLVHRYNDKCLFLATSVCPHYCRYCTRSYAVGANTETVTKASLKPKKARWEDMFQYIANTPAIQDVVISGGDSYLLAPHHVRLIGQRLLSIPTIRRLRFASKGPCVSPGRTLDPNDDWTNALIEVVNLGRTMGKHVALHTHFNHVNEFSWVSREASQKLFEAGVTVRNQSVLLRGVNDTKEDTGALIRELADNSIIPYYVYQHDLVRGIEDLRTPLSTILTIERELRGSIAGFMMPQFVVDLPGGGGKRLAAGYESYDKETGRSTFVAPAVKGGDKVYEYWDPVVSLTQTGRERVLQMGIGGGEVGGGAVETRERGGMDVRY